MVHQTMSYFAESATATSTKNRAILGIGFLLLVLVWPLNGQPLVYFDTLEYLHKGNSFLDIGAGWLSSTTAEGQSVTGFAADGKGAASLDETDSSGNRQVIGNRSAIYALFLGVFDRAGILWMIGIIQTLCLIASLLIPVRAAARAGILAGSPTAVTGVAAIIACLGSAPFYTSFLMPDIFAPVLILTIAGVCVFFRSMTRFEVTAALLLMFLGMVTHPSHMLIGAALVPFCCLAAMLRAGVKNAWFPLLALSTILAFGAMERVSFNLAASQLAKAEVVYRPFLTARLISDGPGYLWLEEKCPSEEIAACALYEMYPTRADVPHVSGIIFGKGPGSVQLLDEPIQMAISRQQFDFAFQVLTSEPLAVTNAVAANLFRQFGRVGVGMTLGLEDANNNPTWTLSENFTPRLAAMFAKPYWLSTLDRFHQIVYIVSGIIVLLLVCWPNSRLSKELRFFAVIVFVGVFLNAFVCSAISGPSERYGARVAFLLPIIATLLVAGLRRPRVQADITVS